MGTFHFLENASSVKSRVGEIKPLIQILGDELVLAVYPYFTSYIYNTLTFVNKVLIPVTSRGRMYAYPPDLVL